MVGAERGDGGASDGSGSGFDRGDCCCCAAKESAAVGDGVGIGFAESMESGRVLERERAMAAKEGNETDGGTGGDGGRRERSCVPEREWARLAWPALRGG